MDIVSVQASFPFVSAMFSRQISLVCSADSTAISLFTWYSGGFYVAILLLTFGMISVDYNVLSFLSFFILSGILKKIAFLFL